MLGRSLFFVVSTVAAAAAQTGAPGAPVMRAAVETDVAPPSPRFTRLSVAEGLSQSSVSHILQDRKGLFWFGTQEGLNRYDGYRFTVHHARERDGFLRDHEITSLIDDADGNLWVGTSRGLYRHDLDTGRFDACAGVDQLRILDVIAAADGRIVFAASDRRLWVLDRGDVERRPRPLHEGPFAALVDVAVIAPAEGSSIWAAAQGRLFKVDLGRDAAGGRVTEVLRDLGTISVLAPDRRGDLWIGRTGAETLRYRAADGHVDRFPQAPLTTLAILPAKSGDVWIGARGGGLSRLDPSTGRVVTHRHDPEDPASLTGNDVAAIYEDAVGAFWVGSWAGGVDRFDPEAQAFRTLRPRPRVPDSLPANDVVSIEEAPDRTLWMGSRTGLVMTGDLRSGRFRTVVTLDPGQRPRAIAWWDGRVLVGSSVGLVVLDPVSGRETAIDAELHTLLGERPIEALRAAPDGAWFGSGNEVFRAIRDTAGGPLRVERLVLPGAGAVSAFSVIGRGRMWIGTDAGSVMSVVWNDAGAATIRELTLGKAARDSIVSRGFITVLHEDRSGTLWAGTRRGLGKINIKAGEIAWLGEQDGLPSTTIAGIAGDADGRVWVAHNRGLTRIDPASGAMVHFGEREGAQGRGYADDAWASGASGWLYFAGNGVTAFDPRDVRINTHAPKILFTGLEVLHRPVAPDWLDPGSPLQRTIDTQQEVTLGPEATVFSVEMAPLHYVDPLNNRLRYRLDGFDSEWIETGMQNRVATYTNLAPGRYVLRARAGTKNGLWSDQEATLAIHILPPWWRTRSALAAWASLGLIVSMLVWNDVRRRARTRMALLEREALRRESLTDPLTGLHNRRFLVTHLQHEVPKVLRLYRVRGPAAADAGDDLLMLLVDVDHFKSINDRHSHSTGDRILNRIAATIEAHVRDSDLAVRWGGDEFLIVCRSFRREGAAEYAERLRIAVAALGTTMAAEGGPACTVSIGFAPFPLLPSEPEALTWEQTLEFADYALRHSKARQRNSYTGVSAGRGLTAAALLQFLAAGADATLPSGVKITSATRPPSASQGSPDS
jgi:diguanylate cyclase (GGDEF)-like protein